MPADAPVQEYGSGTVKVAPDLAYKLRIICSSNGQSIAEFLDPHIRSDIESEFRRVTQRMAKLAKAD